MACANLYDDHASHKPFRESFASFIAEAMAAAGIGGAGRGLSLHNDVTTPYYVEYCNDEQAAAVCSSSAATAT